MSASTKSYYIDINRFSAQDSESTQTNIWDYSLNDTIVAPSGSEVSVHQAFINQKGITGQSIEFEEDLTETIYYYGYITEQEQAVPVLQDPLETKRGEKHSMNEQKWGYVNLLNNAASGNAANVVGRGKGRRGLWNMLSTITEGTYQHLDATKFGGSGAPLILSDPPAPDETQDFPLFVAITPPNSLAGVLVITPQSGLNKFIATENTVNKLIYQQGQLRGITGNRIHFGTSFPVADNFTKQYGSNSHLEIATLDIVIGSPTYGHGTFSHGWAVGAGGANSIQAYEVPVFNAWGDGTNGGTASETGNIFQKGRIDTSQAGYKIDAATTTREIKVGQRVYDKVGNTIVPMGCKVSALKADGTGFFVSNEAGTLIDFGIGGGGAAETRVKTNVEIYLNDDNNYYCSPRPLSAQITVPRGIYGIQQVIELINNQLNGLAAPDSKIPQKPYDSALIAGTYDGMINQGTQGFTTKIKPVRYRDAPDSIPVDEIDPKLNAVDGNIIPDHTFVAAIDYAKTYESRKAINMKNRTNFTTKIAGSGYVGYMMDNDVAGLAYVDAIGGVDGVTLIDFPKAYNSQGISLSDISTAAKTVTSVVANPNTSGKSIADYQIGNTTSITIGAPEANIQFDTDTSSFSLNNLHASWRIPSTDILGNDIINKGEVGVGLKRCALICDAQPYSEYQNIWGSEGRTIQTTDNSATQLRAQIEPDTNILVNIRFLDNNGMPGPMSFMTVGAKLEPVDTHPHEESSQKLPNPANGEYVEIIEIVPAAVKTSESRKAKGYPDPDDAIGFYSVRVKFPTAWNSNKQVFKSGFTDDQIGFKVTGQESGTKDEQQQMISSFQRPKTRIGGAIVYNFSQSTAIKFSDRPSVSGDASYNQHASFRDFFSSKRQAEKIWKTKTLWGKLGFSYQQFNEEDYFENIIQYCHPKTFKIRGVTSDTVLDNTTIPTISTQVNPSDYKIESIYGGQTVKLPQTYNNFDMNTPRTELQRYYPDTDSQMPETGLNQDSYGGSVHTFTTMMNIVAKPTPISAEELPTLSKFGYYLITSDLVPTYKDIVSKGDPLGLLGVVPKTSLSSQDFIPLADSDIVQVLNQDTQINNIRVKILNPDLTNPQLNENSSVILRIDVPVASPPTSPTAAQQPSQKKQKSKK